jgi:hypothetical protein
MQLWRGWRVETFWLLIVVLVMIVFALLNAGLSGE